MIRIIFLITLVYSTCQSCEYEQFYLEAEQLQKDGLIKDNFLADYFHHPREDFLIRLFGVFLVVAQVVTLMVVLKSEFSGYVYRPFDQMEDELRRVKKATILNRENCSMDAIANLNAPESYFISTKEYDLLKLYLKNWQLYEKRHFRKFRKQEEKNIKMWLMEKREERAKIKKEAELRLRKKNLSSYEHQIDEVKEKIKRKKGREEQVKQRRVAEFQKMYPSLAEESEKSEITTLLLLPPAPGGKEATCVIRKRKGPDGETREEIMKLPYEPINLDDVRKLDDDREFWMMTEKNASDGGTETKSSKTPDSLDTKKKTLKKKPSKDQPQLNEAKTQTLSLNEKKSVGKEQKTILEPKTALEKKKKKTISPQKTQGTLEESPTKTSPSVIRYSRPGLSFHQTALQALEDELNDVFGDEAWTKTKKNNKKREKKSGDEKTKKKK